MNNGDLNKIKGLSQNLGDDLGIDKGKFIQHYSDGSIDNEMTIILAQVENALKGSFNGVENDIKKGIDLYKLKKLENAINIFWKKVFPRGGLADRYELYNDYDISYPKIDFVDLSTKSLIIPIDNIIFEPERNFLRFYIGGTEIFIKNKAFDDFMNIYTKDSDEINI